MSTSNRLDLPDPTVTASGKGVTGMEYKIIGSTLQAVLLELDPGETVYSESGGMAWMSHNIDMKTSGRGGAIAEHDWLQAIKLQAEARNPQPIFR